MNENYITNFIDFKGRKFDIDADVINGYHVQSDVPPNAHFTDTTYFNLKNNITSENTEFLVDLPPEQVNYINQTYYNGQGEWKEIEIDISSIPQSQIDKAKIRKSVKENNNPGVAFGDSSVLSNLYPYTVSIGENNVTESDYQFVVGSGSQYNATASLFILGNDNNIFTIEEDGNMKIFIDKNQVEGYDNLLYNEIQLLGWDNPRNGVIE